MGRVRFRDRDWVRTTFWDRNVDPDQQNILLGKITVTLMSQSTKHHDNNEHEQLTEPLFYHLTA